MFQIFKHVQESENIEPDAPLGGASTGLPGLGFKRPVVKTRNRARNGI